MLQILLLKRDSDQTPQPDTDLHPPDEDLLIRFLVTGSFDAVVLAFVPDGFAFERSHRLPLGDDIFVIKEWLTVLYPMQTGFGRW